MLVSVGSKEDECENTTLFCKVKPIPDTVSKEVGGEIVNE